MDKKQKFKEYILSQRAQHGLLFQYRIMCVHNSAVVLYFESSMLMFDELILMRHRYLMITQGHQKLVSGVFVWLGKKTIVIFFAENHFGLVPLI